MSSSRPAKRTLSAMLMESLDQEDMTDLYLMGTDDVKIPAYHNVLACQSDFFRNMPAGNKVVKLRYSSKVLRAMVNYCITGNIAGLDGPFDNETSVREMVQLIACAHYLGITHLHDEAVALVKAEMEKHNTLIACAVFDEAVVFGEPAESVKLDALGVIRKFPEKSLLSKPGVSALRKDTLVDVLANQEMRCEEIVLFRALNQWATAEVDDNSSDFGSEGNRANIAKRLAASHINLSAIQPSYLIGIVRNSSLVDENLIFNAFEAQALLAEKEMNISFSRPRAEPGVAISGAGEDAVNGFYKEDGEYAGYPKFTKNGVWEGESRTFCVYKHGRGGRVWYIAVVEKNGDIGSGEFDFYMGRCEENAPSKLVHTCALGRHPCPVLTE